jgi:transcriptional regulator with XRE-family HTH domain
MFSVRVALFFVAMNESTLGDAIRLFRKGHGWTLRQMSDKVGIPFSTLAKVERNKLTLTYEKLRQVARGLNMTTAELLARAEAPTDGPLIIGRRSLGPAGNSVTVSTATRSEEYLCTDIRSKRMVPIISRIRPGGVDDAEPPLRCVGEEFLFVLEGAIEVRTQCYMPVTLSAGNWIYFDSAMAQAIVAKHCSGALVLTVCCGEDSTILGLPRE